MERFKYSVSFLNHMAENEFLRELFDPKLMKLIEIFISEKNKELYLRELSKRANVSGASTFRILNKLCKTGLIKVKQIKKFKFYQWEQNEKTALLEELFKKDILQKFLSLVKDRFGIELIILYGKKTDSKADIFLIGNIADKTEIEAIAKAIKEDLGFEINYLIFSGEQFSKMTDLGLYSQEKKVLWKTI